MLVPALVVLCVLMLVGLVRLASRGRALQREFEGAEQSTSALQKTATELRKELASARERVDALAVYEGILDAVAEAESIRRVAATEAESTRISAAKEAEELRELARKQLTEIAAEVSSRRAQAESDLADLRRRATERANELEARGAAALETAEQQAALVIRNAQSRAEEIAGDALKAVQEARTLERQIQALRNIVDGYGDRYIIPSHSLVEDLADDFGHVEAGQRLKAIRDQVKAAIRDGKAATCDYVEANRRETAVRFVIDAFNGKVDSALSRTKHDNYGTLKAEIEDAAVVVNAHGAAFRNARIDPQYVALRTEELRWACVVQQLKLEEREEQRRIREQIREEERARREIERAMKDSAKEEEIVRRAMEKAQAQLAKATEAQKAQYESQLADLEQRLRDAEEKNRRAISMAEQTKRGHVYVISNVGSFGDHIYKIGLTRRMDPMERVRELGDSSVPFEFDVHAMIWAEDAPALERMLHKHFVLQQVNKVNHRKEFFRADLMEVRTEIEKMGLTAHWTMTALAREYRESQAIERAIENDPRSREQWLTRQLELDPVGSFAEGGEDAAEPLPA